MYRTALLFVVIFRVCCFLNPIFAQDPEPAPVPPPTPIEEKIKLVIEPEDAQPGQIVRIQLKGVKMMEGTSIFWDVLNGDRILDKTNLEDLGSRLLLSDVPKNPEIPYRIRVFGVSNGKQFATATDTYIGRKSPTPPAPNPVDPKPDVKPDPVKPSKGTVLVIWEEKGSPVDVVTTVDSVPFREYLAAHCLTAADGRPQYRFYDDDLEDSVIRNSPTAGPFWADAYKQLKEARAAKGKSNDDAFIMVTNGTDGDALPLPVPASKAIEFTAKYLGN